MAKVLLFSFDPLGNCMAGPAIRYWEFAHALAEEHEVTLVSSQTAALTSAAVTVRQINLSDVGSLSAAIKEHDLIVSQVLPIQIAYYVKKYGKKIILDCYDPLPIEFLEMHRHSPENKKKELYFKQLNAARYDFLLADKVICASERQRDFWLGFMCSLELLTPATYEQDTTFKNKIGIVPFGMSATPPKKTGPGLRQKFKLKESDFVLIWGGGIWNWFDPLTLIHAMHHLSAKHPHIKLIFMGTRHPNHEIGEMKMTQDAVALSKQLNLFETQVFFNFGWIPYAERQNYLLEANAAVSTHFDNIETRFSFRTRLLDYLWADLPIICTEGDYFADLVKEKKMGTAVAAKDAKALEAAILTMASQPEFAAQCSHNIALHKEEFLWKNTTLQLKGYVRQLAHEKPHTSFAGWLLARYAIKKVKNKGLLASLAFALRMICVKIGFRKIVTN